MRHAKAEPFASTDHERRLTDKGRSSARDAGVHLHEQGLEPDYAVVSSAVRTRETWDAVAESFDGKTQVSFDEAVFTGSPDVVLETLRAVPEDARTVLFIGHNPTAAYLCHLLDDGEGDPDALSGLLRGFPPGALTVLELTERWCCLAAETGRVVDYYVGRG